VCSRIVVSGSQIISVGAWKILPVRSGGEAFLLKAALLSRERWCGLRGSGGLTAVIKYAALETSEPNRTGDCPLFRKRRSLGFRPLKRRRILLIDSTGWRTSPNSLRM
jgi:hypothetical protein